MFYQQVRNLRIGVMMKTILPALAHAVVIDGKYSNSPVLSLEGIKPQLQVCLPSMNFLLCNNIWECLMLFIRHKL